MASLKFIMDSNDDLSDPPPPGMEDDPGRHNTIPPPSSSSGQGGLPSQASFPSHVSGYPSQLRRNSSPAITPVATGKRRNTASSSASKGSRGHSGLEASSSRHSPRRQSTTSIDSMDQAGYGSAASSSSLGAGLNPSNSPMRPMPANSGGSEMPVKYTPITGRVSRARKGVPVHTCEVCRPPKVSNCNDSVLLVEGTRSRVVLC